MKYLDPAGTMAAWLALRNQQRPRRTKLGLVGYAHLCAALAGKPMTSTELQAFAGLGHVAGYRFLSTMHALGRVHITGWRLPPHTRALAVYAYGPGVDLPPPTHRGKWRPPISVVMPTKRYLCPSVVAFVHFLRTLEVPVSRSELTQATGLHPDTLQAALLAMVGLQLAHVVMWMDKVQGGPPVAQFELGPGRNAPMPKPKRRQHRELLNQRSRTTAPFRLLLRAMAPAVAADGVAS